MMVNLKSICFFDGSSNALDSRVIRNDVSGEQIVVQVSGLSGASIVFKGCMDEDYGYSDIAVIDLSNYKVLQEIEEDGMYAFSIQGISAFKAVCSGTANVVVCGMII